MQISFFKKKKNKQCKVKHGVRRKLENFHVSQLKVYWEGWLISIVNNMVVFRCEIKKTYSSRYLKLRFWESSSTISCHRYKNRGSEIGTENYPKSWDTISQNHVSPSSLLLLSIYNPSSALVTIPPFSPWAYQLSTEH